MNKTNRDSAGFEQQLQGTPVSSSAPRPPHPKGSAAQVKKKRIVRYTQSSEPHFKRTFKISLFVHLSTALVFWTAQILHSWLGLQIFPWMAPKPLQMQSSRTAIRVDIVDLPAVKLSDLAKVDALAPVATQLSAPTEQKTPEVGPSDTAMKLKDAELAKQKAKADADAKKKTVAEKARKDAQQKAAQARLDELQARLRTDARRQELMEGMKGSTQEGGRPLLAGNILSEGYATHGDIADSADVYQGELRRHLRQHWELPGWMTATQLQARVIVKLAPDGRVMDKKFLKRSGNSDFDEAIERAFVAASPFPPPPREMLRVYMEDGIEWGFPE